MKKYKYNINNLDCAGCAKEVEDGLNKNKDLKNVVVNFNTCKLTYESDKDFDIKELNSLIKKIEPDASISSDDVENKKDYHLSILIIGLIIGFIGYFISGPKCLKLILYIISYIILLYKTFFKALKILFKNKSINENMLITISCVGALAIDKVLEGMMVVTLYTIGKILEEKAINNSRKSIKSILDIKQAYANLKLNTKTKKINVEDINIDDILIVKKGERVPVDGVVISGDSSLDMSFLTGESDLVSVKGDDVILSGSINKGDVIEMRATSLFKNSTVSKILELLDDATDKKTHMETTISKISKVYTPLVIVLAVLVIILLPLLFNVSFSESLYRGLTFLVISCPCAIAISVPLSYFTGIGTASKNGILIKGSNYLDSLSSINNIIFDKTGTLTNGSFKVSKIDIDKNSGYSKDQVIDILVKGESFSNHPIARSIMKLKDNVDNNDVKSFKEIEGKGISFKLNNKKVIIGNKSLCNCDGDAMLHLNIDGHHIANITIDDGIKENAKDTILKLKKMGIETYMFTGDKKDIAIEIGNSLSIDHVKYEMLPEDKFKCFEEVSKDNKITAFVGDGINDAPVLKRSDIGISMGGVGTDSAIEASDIVLMKDDLSKIPLAINISLYTKKIIKQNLIFAILVKVLILLFSVLGLANMWFAVFADTGVTLLTIVNTLRIMNKFN